MSNSSKDFRCPFLIIDLVERALYIRNHERLLIPEIGVCKDGANSEECCSDQVRDLRVPVLQQQTPAANRCLAKINKPLLRRFPKAFNVSGAKRVDKGNLAGPLCSLGRGKKTLH